MGNKEAPLGVKIIAILYFIGAAISLIGGLMFIFGGSSLGFLAGGLGGGLLAGAAIVGGIIMILLGVLALFVGLGLWKTKKWARIVAIILAILAVLSALFGLFSPGGTIGEIINLLLSGWIGWYLIFSTSAKQAFA